MWPATTQLKPPKDTSDEARKSPAREVGKPNLIQSCTNSLGYLPEGNDLPALFPRLFGVFAGLDSHLGEQLGRALVDDIVEQEHGDRIGNRKVGTKRLAESSLSLEKIVGARLRDLKMDADRTPGRNLTEVLTKSLDVVLRERISSRWSCQLLDQARNGPCALSGHGFTVAV